MAIVAVAAFSLATLLRLRLAPVPAPVSRETVIPEKQAPVSTMAPTTAAQKVVLSADLEKVVLAGSDSPAKLDISPDGKTIAGQVKSSSSLPGVVLLWDTRTGALKPIQPAVEEGSLGVVSFSSDSRSLIIGRWTTVRKGYFSVLDVATGTRRTIDPPTGYEDSVMGYETSLALGPSPSTGHETMLALRAPWYKRGESGTVVSRAVLLLNTATTRPTGVLPLSLIPTTVGSSDGDGHDQGLDFTEDGKTLAVPISGARVQLWDVATRKPKLTLTPTGWGTEIRVFSPHGDLLATATSDDTHVTLYDTYSGKKLRDVEASGQGFIAGMDFSSDGKLLAVAMQDGSIKIYSTPHLAFRNGQFRPVPHPELLADVAFAPDNKAVLFTTVNPPTLYRWRIK